MVTKVIMPKLAANIEEATIGQWFKQEGEPVAAGEPLFEAITDKAAVEVKAEAAGVLRRIVARENSVVPVGQVIALVGGADEPLPEVEAPRAAPRPAATAVKASFGARRLAKELGVDLAALTPSRPDGRITEDDVRQAAAQTRGPAIRERLPLSPLKRAVDSHLARIAREVVAAFVSLDVRFDAVQRALPGLSRQAGRPVLARDVILHEAARLLPAHPLLNACYSDDAILVYQPVNIGLAFDIERDNTVLVPVIRDADRKPLAELAREAAALAEHARGHHLDLGEQRDATFTIADQSALGIGSFVPILNERQSAILAVSSVRQAAVADGQGIVAAPVANLAVAFDHRVLNATAAARFLHALKDALEGLSAPADSC
ncbi:MAG TPA: 2-oxo acid dehydrogenase subunit E2 [Planctomycetota bacterium]|nr:2-oxo acid dehydrogenase subunit E2 [Planctomycetota bacterium]HRR83033.1 2-oxo acid dehydrogenase subunit E2 [Planctomycetota bacterium]HRT94983.1 2-oxo acid dehydrogenase subunit E2 [Planctomycetota bacterium]